MQKAVKEFIKVSGKNKVFSLQKAWMTCKRQDTNKRPVRSFLRMMFSKDNIFSTGDLSVLL